jgi:PAS domain S-box-containing protein
MQKKDSVMNQNTFEALFDQFPNPLIITDVNGSIELMNHKFKDIYNDSIENSGKDGLSLLFTGNPQLYDTLISKIKTGNEWTCEINFDHKNKENCWKAIELKPINDLDGKGKNFLIIIEDITMWKFREKKLYELLTISEETNKLKSAYLTNVSHELRTPLNAILGFSELLINRDNGIDFSGYPEIIHRSALRLSDIINDLIYMSKIETGTIEITINKFNIVELLKDSIQRYELAASNKNLYIHLSTSTDVLLVELSSELLSSCINNLLNYAINYTNDGGIDVILEELADNDVRYVIIRIIDTGIGISKERLSLFFEEFRQMDVSMTKIHEESGMGFKLTKDYIKKMGGQITAESELGKGSKFTIILPIVFRGTIQVANEALIL